MELDHFQVKLRAKTDGNVRIDDAIPIFHHWIQENKIPDALMLDVVDYAHVPGGPGILLMGHEEYYSLSEEAEDTVSLLFCSKISRAKNSSERLAEALERSERAARLLAEEAEWDGKLHFDSEQFEIRVNDRRLAPNTKETFAKFQDVLESGLKARLGNDRPFHLHYASGSDPRRLFGVRVEIQ